MKITVFTKPSCVQCDATIRHMDGKKMKYSTVNLVTDPTALETVKELGYLQAPVIITEDENGNIVKHWSGYNPDAIEAIEQGELIAA